MENYIIFLKCLPKLDELTFLQPDEYEINYIFEITTNSIKKIIEELENNKKELDEIIQIIEEPFYLIESVIERMWEKINIGHFSEVPLNTRKTYSVANYIKIVFLLLLSSNSESKLEKCNECLDKAILIGNTENLYENNEKFLKEIEEFLNNSIQVTKENLLYIEPIPFQDYPNNISVLDCPTISEFNKTFFIPKIPVLIRNTISHWPACMKWRDPSYLLKVAGNRSVPIEIGSNYSSNEWSQELIKIKEFLKRHFGSENQHEIEYLAQHELFDQIPKLKEDIRIPDYCYCSSSSLENEIDIKAWLGPKGTISPMHHDPKNNILCQVFGTKKVILASPDDTPYLYPHENRFLNNTSQIDATNLDFELFPLLKNAKFFELILQENECLYIPPKWWHYVQSLSKSFSVSFWWN